MSCTKTGTANQANYENNSTVKGTSSITSTELTDDDPSHYIVRYSLGDYVWEDVNKNGLQDTDESGVANIEVELFDSDGNSIATTTTDENGSYKFENLDNGDYQVKFKIPEDYIVTAQNIGDDDAVDSDANLTGDVDKATIQNDNNFTIDMGIYIPKASIGDFVWDDVNRNGIQDENESGVANVEVILLDGDGNEVNRTQTDENGKYLFTDLKIGDYQVEFNLSTIPNGYMVTPQNVGDDDAKDSDANQTNGKTKVTTLEDGENDLSWDMGIHKKYSLGDFVWDDLNKNGIQDADEPGIANVEVELLDENGKSLAKTTTDSNGKYQFDNLDNGDYQVKFTIPEDYVVTVKDAGGDDTKDSDPDSDGTVNVTIKDDDNFTIDMGIYTPKASIGDFVWDDINRNGIQDENESGVANVEVILLDGDGNEVNRTQTDENGKYLFTDFKLGIIKLSLTSQLFQTITQSQAKIVGDDDGKDSDAKQNKEKRSYIWQDGEDDSVGIWESLQEVLVSGDQQG